jgi:hypothetical protein
MEFWMNILGTVVMPVLLIYIGWRGIAPEKRKGALRVCVAIVAVIAAGTVVFFVVVVYMTPKWVAKDCDAAFLDIARGPQAAEPTLAREPFLAACRQLPMVAAECTAPSYAQKFPDHCSRYVDQIRAVLPKLDLGSKQGPSK